MNEVQLKLTDFMLSCLSFKNMTKQTQLQLLITKEKQFVVKSSNCIVFCCEIPCDFAKEIKIERFHNDCIVIVKSNQDTGGVISFREHKVLGWWNSIQDIVIDDYLCVGHDQVIVLLKFNSDIEYIVTDFRCCFVDTQNIQSNQMEDNNEMTLGSNSMCHGYKSVLKAVQNKIISASLVLNDLQSNIEEKKEFLQSCCYSLKQQTCERPTVTLFSHCNYVNMLTKIVDIDRLTDKDNIDDTYPLQVISIRKAVCDENLLVYLTLLNVCLEPVCNISLSILSNDASACNSSILFQRISKSDNQTYEKQCKQIKCDNYSDCFRKNDKITLTASINYSCVQLNDAGFFLLLHYETVARCKKHSVCIGHVEVDPSDIINGKLSHLDDKLHNLYYDNLFVQHSLNLTSQITDLCSLPSILSKRLPSSSTMLGKVTVIDLHHVKASIRLKPGFASCEGLVYTKTPEMFYVLLKELEELLPGDITMTVKLNCNRNDLCLGTIKQELHSKVYLLKNLMNDIQIRERDENTDVIIIDAVVEKKRKRSASIDSYEINLLSLIIETNHSILEALKQ